MKSLIETARLINDPYERILILADLIEALPPKHEASRQDEFSFAMDNVYHSCGTPSCIGGWTIFLWGDNPENNASEEVERHLKLSNNDAFHLCYVETHSANAYAEPGTIGFISPERAAKVLRLVADGTSVLDAWNETCHV